MTSNPKTQDNQDMIARAVAKAFGPILDDILAEQETWPKIWSPISPTKLKT